MFETESTRVSAKGRAWISALVVVVLGSRLVFADFAEPVQLTESDGQAIQTAVGHDPACNVFVLSAVNGTIQVDLIGANLRLTTEIPGEGVGRADPGIEINSRGEAFVCLSQVHPDTPQGGRDIYLTRNTGGQFLVPERVSESPRDDGACRITLDRDGRPRLVWIRKTGDPEDPTHVFYRNHDAGQTVDMGSGSSASLFLDWSNVPHVVYMRGRELYLVTGGEGGFGPETLLLTAPSAEGTDVLVAIDELGAIFIVYTSNGSLYFVSRGDKAKEFTPPRLLDNRGVGDVDMHIRPGGALSITYTKRGDLYLIQGIGAFLLEPVGIRAPSTGIESGPRIVVDRSGTTHLSFLRDDEVYYTNNAGAVVADFTAAPRDGEVPLEVTFQDLSSGEIQVWQWDFGDGGQSARPSPTHLYERPGKYTVTLTVFSADRESTVVKEDFITVQESFNHMMIPDQFVVPNQEDVWFPVIASHRDPIQGFQVHAVFDSNVLTLKDCSLQYTEVEAMGPDIYECNIFERRCEVGVIFEFEVPFTNPVLPRGDNQRLVQLVFDVSNRAPFPSVTEVQLINNSEISRIFNIFTVDGFTKLPVLDSSRVEIIPPFPLPRFFLRGDADSNRRLEITDAIVILSFLFLGGDQPTCMDAGDVNDFGRIDISAAISLLNFLFLGGRAPAVPFPNAGLDPTEDDFPECVTF